MDERDDRSTNDSEDEPSRLDRELEELLQGLRVLLPGVQVLFAFLLTVPFAQGYVDTTSGQRALYFASFAATTVSAVLLISPSVRHRARFRRHDKEALVRSANRLALVGTGFLAAAIAAAGCLITDVIYGTWAAVLVGIGIVLLVAWFWYGWAAHREASRGHDPGSQSDRASTA